MKGLATVSTDFRGALGAGQEAFGHGMLLLTTRSTLRRLLHIKTNHILAIRLYAKHEIFAILRNPLIILKPQVFFVNFRADKELDLLVRRLALALVKGATQVIVPVLFQDHRMIGILEALAAESVTAGGEAEY